MIKFTDNEVFALKKNHKEDEWSLAALQILIRDDGQSTSLNINQKQNYL